MQDGRSSPVTTLCPKQYKLDIDQLNSYAKEGYTLDNSGEQIQFFQVITVEGDELCYVAYTALGQVYDRAVIKKDFATGKKKLIQQEK